MIEAVLAWLALVAVAAGVVLAYRAGRIGVAVGLLFTAASFSRVTAPLGPYAVRLEQPALILLVELVLLRERDALRKVVTGQKWLIAAAGLYLGANLVSSALFAASPFDSLRIAGWLGLSMIGGLAIAALVARVPDAARALPGWIVGAACVQVAVGLVAVVSESVLNTTWGVQANDVVLGKTYALSWEANILAINLAMALPFVMVPGSDLGVGRRERLAATLWLGFGLGLAYSRGAAVGLVAAVVVVAALIAWASRSDPVPALRRHVMPMLRLGLAAAAAAFLTAGGLDVLAGQGVGWTDTTVIIGQPTPGASPLEGSPSPAATVQPSPTSSGPPRPSPTPRLVGTGDTLGLRLNNLGIALGELARSPVVGLGTDSFRQRHVEESCRCPAHIANLAVASLYDSGILGFVGLAGFLGGVMYLAWRRGDWAYLVALLAMAIAYQVTDAIRFASNWVLMGVILGAAAAAGSARRRTVDRR